MNSPVSNATQAAVMRLVASPLEPTPGLRPGGADPVNPTATNSRSTSQHAPVDQLIQSIDAQLKSEMASLQAARSALVSNGGLRIVAGCAVAATARSPTTA
jgi:hypothetical protein